MRKKIEVEDKRELVERLMRGEPIERSDGTKLLFNPTFCGSPFGAVKPTGTSVVEMGDSWNCLGDLYIEVPWQDNIGKLCRVWNNGQVWVVRLIVEYDSNIGLFKDDYGITWQNAIPMTSEKIAEYTVQLTV